MGDKDMFLLLVLTLFLLTFSLQPKSDDKTPAMDPVALVADASLVTE